jgi:2-polyprenyl-6-methoxyphenol hydroxylase-like FAD-dependent oxidoreductase
VVERDGRAEEVHARLVVGADGRSSMVRRWAGFSVRSDPDRVLFSGVLLDGVEGPPDTGLIFFHPDRGRQALLFPQPSGRVRVYVGCHRRADPPPRDADLARFVTEVVRTGAPEETLARAPAAGPLATFDPADTWVDHPYRDGVALIGDAAAASDPTWGQGMSLTLRDVRTLRDALCETADWDAAGHAYAAAHDDYYAVIHRVDQWFTDLFLEVGPEAEALRARALPGIMADATRIVDVQFGGPELPSDEHARRRFFGEE